MRDRVRVVGPRRGRERSGHPVLQQDLVALGHSGLAAQHGGLAIGLRPGQQVVPFVRPAHAPHPAPAVADADHAHHAAHARIQRGGPDRRGAAVTGAVEAEARPVHARPRAEKGERGLRVGDAAEGRKPGARPLARAPALVVEGEHHIARLRKHTRIVGQIEALHPGIAVAEQDTGPRLARARVGGPVEIAREPHALAEKTHALALHGAPDLMPARRCPRKSFLVSLRRRALMIL